MMYLAHPRTASISTSWALCNYLGFEKAIPGDHHSCLNDEKVARPFCDDERGEWTVCTTVRNHWDAAVSWRYKRRHNRTSGEPWDGPQWKELFLTFHWIRGRKMYGLHADDADVILRYETLESDLNELLAQFGMKLERLPRDNVTPGRNGRHYRQFFTEGGRDFIARRFREEIERFGYSY
ncbi:MAG: hypothetical protein JSV16_13295 [Candidatus Hydrogenedentota bacterium]|nr:MAG: hypothetical protein JSV16_13295 [Candidatus Hydrogenedentota bacterium]